MGHVDGIFSLINARIESARRDRHARIRFP